MPMTLWEESTQPLSHSKSKGSWKEKCLLVARVAESCLLLTEVDPQGFMGSSKTKPHLPLRADIPLPFTWQEFPGVSPEKARL